jgi:hypothetical protein
MSLRHLQLGPGYCGGRYLVPTVPKLLGRGRGPPRRNPTHQLGGNVLGKAHRCDAIGADHQQGDDDVNERQPVGEVGPAGGGFQSAWQSSCPAPHALHLGMAGIPPAQPSPQKLGRCIPSVSLSSKPTMASHCLLCEDQSHPLLITGKPACAHLQLLLTSSACASWTRPRPLKPQDLCAHFTSPGGAHTSAHGIPP